jgi:hypothetical protein
VLVVAVLLLQRRQRRKQQRQRLERMFLLLLHVMLHVMLQAIFLLLRQVLLHGMLMMCLLSGLSCHWFVAQGKVLPGLPAGRQQEAKHATTQSGPQQHCQCSCQTEQVARTARGRQSGQKQADIWNRIALR